MRDEMGLLTGNVEDRFRPGAVSVVVHVVVLLALVGVFRRAPRIAPYKLPGTEHGQTLLTYYAAGSTAHATTEETAKLVKDQKLLASARPVPTAPKPDEKAAPSVAPGVGSSAQNGLGDGEISMAVLTSFPHPKPDLSSLPHGTQGDVVLDAVIDEHGRIADLKLLKGLGAAVDEQVIAAVRQWTYNPATKNGSPVPSEQELHFHYERG